MSKTVDELCVWTRRANNIATTSCQRIFCLEVRNKKEGDDCPLCWHKIKFVEAGDESQ